MSEIFWQSDTNFWTIIDGKIDTIELGTKTIAETEKSTPIGAYTSFRTYDSLGVLRLSKHFDRLEETARLAGYEIKLGGEAIIVGRLLNYQGTPEIEKGYFCHYSAPESLENLYDDPNTNQDSVSPDTCTKELIHGILFIRKGSKRYTIIGNEVR